MKKFLIAAAAVCGLGLSSLTVHAADEKKADGGGVTGVLIDNKCGAGKNEAAAAKHPQACSMKDACAATGYQIVSGDKHLKLDEKGQELAKAYLAKAETTHVVVEGTVDGETLKATSIKAAADDEKPAKEGKSEKPAKKAEKSEKTEK